MNPEYKVAKQSNSLLDKTISKKESTSLICRGVEDVDKILTDFSNFNSNKISRFNGECLALIGSSLLSRGLQLSDEIDSTFELNPLLKEEKIKKRRAKILWSNFSYQANYIWSEENEEETIRYLQSVVFDCSYDLEIYVSENYYDDPRPLLQEWDRFDPVEALAVLQEVEPSIDIEQVSKQLFEPREEDPDYLSLAVAYIRIYAVLWKKERGIEDE